MNITLTLFCLIFHTFIFSQQINGKQDENFINTINFGQGVLQFRISSTLRSSTASIAYVEKEAVKWENNFDVNGIPPLDTYGGLDFYLASETSKNAYCMLRFNKTDKFRIYRFDSSGKIVFKDFVEANVLPMKGKTYFTTIYSSFIANEKLYTIFELEGSRKGIKKYYLTEIDQNFQIKTQEMGHSNLAISELKEGTNSKMRCIASNDEHLIYYTVRPDGLGYRMKICYFDFASFGISKEYDIHIPDIQNVSSTPFYSFSSIDYSQNIYPYRSISSELSYETNGAGVSRNVELLDLTNYFPFYYSETKICFFGQTMKNNENGVFKFMVPLDNELDKTISSDFYAYSSLAKKLKLETFSPYQIEYNPKNSALVFETAELSTSMRHYANKLRYYSLNDSDFSEINNSTSYFLPTPYLAIHQEYLEKDGAFSCPDSDPSAMHNTNYLNSPIDLRIPRAFVNVIEGRTVIMHYVRITSLNVPGREKYARYISQFPGNQD